MLSYTTPYQCTELELAGAKSSASFANLRIANPNVLSVADQLRVRTSRLNYFRHSTLPDAVQEAHIHYDSNLVVVMTPTTLCLVAVRLVNLAEFLADQQQTLSVGGGSNANE